LQMKIYALNLIQSLYLAYFETQANIPVLSFSTHSLILYTFFAENSNRCAPPSNIINQF